MEFPYGGWEKSGVSSPRWLIKGDQPILEKTRKCFLWQNLLPRYLPSGGGLLVINRNLTLYIKHGKQPEKAAQNDKMTNRIV